MKTHVPKNSARKYIIPDFLERIISQSIYDRWLSRKAAAHVKRDKRHGNLSATVACYKIGIHKAVWRSEGKDAYTGENLDWDKISEWSNEEAMKGKREYRVKFALLPTVDHVGERSGAANFKICSWRTNDAKSDLNLADFIQLCRRVLQYNNPS